MTGEAQRRTLSREEKAQSRKKKKKKTKKKKTQSSIIRGFKTGEVLWSWLGEEASTEVLGGKRERAGEKL